MKILKRSYGASLAEYAILLSLISVFAILSVLSLGGNVRGVFERSTTLLSSNNIEEPPVGGGGGETPPQEEDIEPVALNFSYMEYMSSSVGEFTFQGERGSTLSDPSFSSNPVMRHATLHLPGVGGCDLGSFTLTTRGAEYEIVNGSLQDVSQVYTIAIIDLVYDREGHFSIAQTRNIRYQSEGGELIEDFSQDGITLWFEPTSQFFTTGSFDGVMSSRPVLEGC